MFYLLGVGMSIQEKVESVGRSRSSDYLPYQRTGVPDLRGAQESREISRLFSWPCDWWKGKVIFVKSI